MSSSPYRRFVVLGSFVIAPALGLVTAALQPDLSGSAAHQLAVIASQRPSAALSAFAFVLMQLPLFVIAIVLSRTLADRGAGRLGNIAGSLAAASAFAHAVIGGSMLMTVTMSERSLNRGQMAALLHRFHNSAPFHLLALLGIAGFVVGWAVFAVALWRTHLVSRLFAAAIGAFIVLEFIVSATVPRASLLGALLFAAALVAIARPLTDSVEAPGVPSPLPT